MNKKNIFKTVILPLLITAAVIAGCSKNDSVLGPNGNQVSFTITQQNGPNNGVEFLFNPSVDTKISRIVSRYAALQFADTISFANTNYTYSKDSVYLINEYVGVVNGQQWNFDFSGSTTGQNNSNYNVTTNYTVH